MTAEFSPDDHLPDDLLTRIRDRAGAVDHDNAFPTDDVAELRDAGYLRVLVPRDRGGAGLSLEHVGALQQRLAAASPATALAVNMHLVWAAVAKILDDRGDSSLSFVHEDAARGKLYAFGISEAGNDLVLFDSTTRAEKTPRGGYAFTGTKIFTSLAPAWDVLGVHGRDDSGPDGGRLVFAFLERSDGVVTHDDWDTIGMRGTQSRTTSLTQAQAAPEAVMRVIDPEEGADPLQFAIFAAFELLVASVYTGIARRSLELVRDATQRRVSKKTGLARSEDPVVRDRVGAMAIALDGVALELRTLTRDIDERVDHGAGWFPLLSGMKHRATSGADRIVDDAATLAGGGSFRNGDELSRLVRDVRAGGYHPSSRESARQSAAAGWLDA